MVHIKEPSLLVGKGSPCGGSGFPLSLSLCSFTICPTLYNRGGGISSCVCYFLCLFVCVGFFRGVGLCVFLLSADKQHKRRQQQYTATCSLITITLMLLMMIFEAGMYGYFKEPPMRII